ncbi:MAG: glycerophosphodiester phosphodiesterase [Fimbriimonadaceae bacterium]|nr:glycerophosphodiester phosphodiesterase [Fimbriimonadaceae bacterium]
MDVVSAVFALITMSKPSAASILERSWSETLVVGHRGAAAYAPENTLPSFTAGWESGSVALECDIHMSADGVPMVMHDTTLDRTTSLKGRVDETPAKVMTDAGVPTLDDLINHVRGRAVLVIEIKAGRGVEQAVVDRVRRRKMEDEVIVFSFNPQIVAEVERLAPELKTVWLSAAPFATHQTPSLLRRLREMKTDAVGFQFRNVHPGLASTLRAARVPLFVWTVPPGEEPMRLKGLNVNFIITDHPRDILGQING